jgi:hypothetical protein
MQVLKFCLHIQYARAVVRVHVLTYICTLRPYSVHAKHDLSADTNAAGRGKRDPQCPRL